MPLSTEQRLSALKSMKTIRRFEEAIAEAVEAGEIKTPVHLYIGQEAVATGVCMSLAKSDYVFGAHRSHGHYLAKGGDIDALAAEIFCRATGCSKGRGGSMHIVAPSVGIFGTSALTGGNFAVSVGTALAPVRLGRDRVSVAFFGDGATEEGVFHESLNFAALHRLPVLFVCENNLYSSHLHISERRP